MVDLLTVAELSAKLRVSTWTIYGWVSQKYIPYFKLRGSVRFRTGEIERWLQKNQSHGRSLRRLRIEDNARPQAINAKVNANAK